MKLLPESSIEKTKRTESVWETKHKPALVHLKAREVQALSLGVIPVFKSHPTISLHHLCLPHLDPHGGSSPNITKLTVTKTEISENSLICPTKMSTSWGKNTPIPHSGSYLRAGKQDPKEQARHPKS